MFFFCFSFTGDLFFFNVLPGFDDVWYQATPERDRPEISPPPPLQRVELSSYLSFFFFLFFSTGFVAGFVARWFIFSRVEAGPFIGCASRLRFRSPKVDLSCSLMSLHY